MNWPHPINAGSPGGGPLETEPDPAMPLAGLSTQPAASGAAADDTGLPAEGPLLDKPATRPAGPGWPKRRPARERTYALLKDRILAGGFAPGERLGEERLAGEYQVSRTPIREALHKLESERLIAPRSGGGFVVTPTLEAEAKELRELRAVLEGYALRLVSLRMTEAALTELETTLARAEFALGSGSLPQLLESNARFREILYTPIADKRRLSQQLISLRQYAQRYRRGAQGSREARRELEGHRKIVAALRVGDAEMCEILMRKQVWNSEEDSSGA